MKNDSQVILISLSLSIFIIVISFMAQKAKIINPMDKTLVLFFIPLPN